MKSIIHDIELKKWQLVYLKLKKNILVTFKDDKELHGMLVQLERAWKQMQEKLKEIYE